MVARNCLQFLLVLFIVLICWQTKETEKFFSHLKAYFRRIVVQKIIGLDFMTDAKGLKAMFVYLEVGQE